MRRAVSASRGRSSGRSDVGSTTARELCDSAAKLTTTSIAWSRRVASANAPSQMSPWTKPIRSSTAGQALPVPRVRQQVVDDDMVVGMPLEPVVHEVRADEAGAAGDEESHRAKASASVSARQARRPSRQCGQSGRPRALAAEHRVRRPREPDARARRSRYGARGRRDRPPRRSPRRSPPTCTLRRRRRARSPSAGRRRRTPSSPSARWPTNVGQPRWSSTTATSSRSCAEAKHRPEEVVTRRAEEPRRADRPTPADLPPPPRGASSDRRRTVGFGPSDSTYGERLRPSKT